FQRPHGLEEPESADCLSKLSLQLGQGLDRPGITRQAVCDEVFDLGSNGQVRGIEVAGKQLLAGARRKSVVGLQLFDKTSPLLGKVPDDDVCKRFARPRSWTLESLGRTGDNCRQGNLMAHRALLKSTICALWRT